MKKFLSRILRRNMLCLSLLAGLMFCSLTSSDFGFNLFKTNNSEYQQEVNLSNKIDHLISDPKGLEPDNNIPKNNSPLEFTSIRSGPLKGSTIIR